MGFGVFCRTFVGFRRLGNTSSNPRDVGQAKATSSPEPKSQWPTPHVLSSQKPQARCAEPSTPSPSRPKSGSPLPRSLCTHILIFRKFSDCRCIHAYVHTCTQLEDRRAHKETHTHTLTDADTDTRTTVAHLVIIIRAYTLMYIQICVYVYIYDVCVYVYILDTDRNG